MRKIQYSKNFMQYLSLPEYQQDNVQSGILGKDMG